MTDHPRWDYWLYEKLDDGRVLPVDHDDWLPKGDVRKDKYSVDTKIWCRKHLWTAEQAALISFSRDPEKVLLDDDLIPWDDEFHEEHSRLAKDIDNLFGLIKDAQETKILPTIFHPGMYIEWAEYSGVDFPPYIKNELDAVERERSHRANVACVDMASPDSEEAPEKRGRSQQKRLENNLTKILLAILLRSGLIKEDLDKLSKDLAGILTDTKNKRGDKDFSLTAPTIKARLEETHDLLK
jgi:hypothetical protein